MADFDLDHIRIWRVGEGEEGGRGGGDVTSLVCRVAAKVLSERKTDRQRGP